MLFWFISELKFVILKISLIVTAIDAISIYLFVYRYRHGNEQQGFGGNKRFWNPNQGGPNGNMYGSYNPGFNKGGKPSYNQNGAHLNGKKKPQQQQQQQKSSNEGSPLGSPTNNKGKTQPGDNLKKPQWDLTALLPFQKNFYVPHKANAERYLSFYLFLFLDPQI